MLKYSGHTATLGSGSEKRLDVNSDGNFSSYLIGTDTTISGHFLWAEMEGWTNTAWPIQPNRPISGKITKMALLNPCMAFKIVFGRKTSFEAL